MTEEKPLDATGVIDQELAATEPSVIERAIDVLIDWRKADGVGTVAMTSAKHPEIARMMTGMSDPALREAIAAMLENAQWHIDSYGSVEHPWAEAIAAVIVAADERMSA